MYNDQGRLVMITFQSVEMLSNYLDVWTPVQDEILRMIHMNVLILWIVMLLQ